MIQKGQQKAVDQWLRGQLYICNKKVYGLEIHDTFEEFYLSIFKQYQTFCKFWIYENCENKNNSYICLMSTLYHVMINF